MSEAAEPVFRTATEVIMNALREEVAMLMTHCTTEQRAFFAKVYPSGIEGMSEEKLRNAIGLCQRTIRKNREATPPAPGEGRET